MDVVKVFISTTCESCNGMCRIPVGEDTDGMGRRYIRHKPCPTCEGGGINGKWITLEELAQLLVTAIPAVIDQVHA